MNQLEGQLQVIHLQPGIYAFDVTDGPIVIASNAKPESIWIEGNGTAIVRPVTGSQGASALANASLFDIRAGARVRMSSMLFRGFDVTPLRVTGGTLTLANCTFEHNTASAIIAESDGDVSLTQVSFDSNSAVSQSSHHGGALRVVNSSAWLVDCAFRDNSAVHGGAIHVEGTSSVDISRAQFLENRAQQGGAINIASGRVKFNRVSVRCATVGCRDATGWRDRTVFVDANDTRVQRGRTMHIEPAATVTYEGEPRLFAPAGTWLRALIRPDQPNLMTLRRHCGTRANDSRFACKLSR